jgi:hypothetical protein
MNRRTLLSTCGLAVVSLTGCIGGNSRDAVINVVEQSVAEDAEVISYISLSEGEQQIARTAVEEEFYHACSELPDALYSLSERFSTIDNSSLLYQETAYELWIRSQDTLRVSTAPTPDADPSHGIL